MFNSEFRIPNGRSAPVALFAAKKKALTTATFALVLTLPFASSASSITNTFLSSSTGTAEIFRGDTIKFEVTIELHAGEDYIGALWNLSGDIFNAELDTHLPFPNTRNLVTNWGWNYVAGKGKLVKMGTNGLVLPYREPVGVPPPRNVTGEYGFLLTTRTGNGNPSMVGTVTIVATANSGDFQGGGYVTIGGGFVRADFTPDFVSISGGEFTVVPEPGTAALMMFGLIGLGVRGRLTRK